MAGKSPSSSPRHNGRQQEKKDSEQNNFFKLGEIRVATEKDCEHFMHIADSNDGWIRKVEKNGFTIYQRECDNSMVKMAKVCGVFKGVKASTAFDVIMDSQFRRSWDDSVINDADVCKLDDCNDIGYYSMKWPAPLKNRDFVNQRSWRCYGEDQFVSFNHSVSHPELPQKKNFIRALSYLTGFVVRSGDTGCNITYVTQSDPKGSIPKWLINFALNKLAPAVFRQLYVATTKYEAWKADHTPGHKPWRYPDQIKLPLVDPSLLSQGSAPTPMLETRNDDEQEEEVPSEESMERIVEGIVESIELKTEKAS
ncbi:START domain-containing protein 10-like [Halichondria panicea]|uniref:START domain-containing protein 10-like n=1 Tax=Halichondria panicea TaxID=6063 RepID=UPI00312BB954